MTNNHEIGTYLFLHKFASFSLTSNSELKSYLALLNTIYLLNVSLTLICWERCITYFNSL